MVMDDPLRRPGTDLPPVPPTAPPTPTTVSPDLTGVARSRHVMQERLTGPDEEPIDADSPTAGPSGPVLASQIKAVDDRRKRNMGIIAAVLAGLLLLGLALAWWLWHEQSRINDLAARQVAASTQQAKVDGQQRNATCLAIQSWRSTYNTASRNAYLGGPLRFDALYTGLAQASGALNCDAG